MLPTSSAELHKLRSLIEDKTKHAYVDDNIQQPAIDDIKLKLLYSMMKCSKLPQPKIEQYILSTMFVQMALDIHEMVPVNNNRNENSTNQKKRQLMVLAGDYYSGLFYSLLSETEDFSVIHILSTAIREINEYKMQLYFNKVTSFTDVFQLVKKIESLLISSILAHFDEIPDQTPIEDFIMLNLMVRERDLLKSSGNLSTFNQLLMNGMNEHALFNQVETAIEQKTESIEKYILGIPKQYPELIQELTRIKEDIFEFNTSIVKEG